MFRDNLERVVMHHAAPGDASELARLFRQSPAIEETVKMSRYSFQGHLRVDTSSAWEDLVGTPVNLSEKLQVLSDFLDGRDNPAISQAHIDKTAVSVARVIAAFSENPYVIRDYTASSSNPREILAPQQTWGSIKPSLSHEGSDEVVTLELLNHKGRLELEFTRGDLDIVIGEIAVHRARCA